MSATVLNGSAVGFAAMMDEKVYKQLESHLIQVNNECIAMEIQGKKKFVRVMLQVLHELIGQMKEANKLFSLLYNRITYVGSYFDGLRVKEATEFDINVVLKLPLVYDKIVVNRKKMHPGFVEVKLMNAKFPEDKLKNHPDTNDVFKWVDSNGLLSHEKVLRWWESIFSKLGRLSTFRISGCDYKVTSFRKAGPAMTAHISGPSVEIDVDLVPVIEFPPGIAPPHIRKKVGNWFIVPKRIPENENLWRMSFPQQEQAIMNGQNKLKMVNRFIKRLRDVNHWQPLSSYYIKSIFLWEAALVKDKTLFNKNLGYLLVYFLRKLAFYLDQKKLPFFWDEEMNLLEKISNVTMENYAGRVKKMICQLEKCCKENETTKIDEMMKTLFYEKNLVNGGKDRSTSLSNWERIDWPCAEEGYSTDMALRKSTTQQQCCVQ